MPAPRRKPPESRTTLTMAGVLFAAVVVLTFAVDELNTDQRRVVIVMLALAAAAVAASIPGVLKLDFAPSASVGLGATGAIVVFVLVYFFQPASFGDDEDEEPTVRPIRTSVVQTQLPDGNEGLPPVSVSPVACATGLPVASPVGTPVLNSVGSPVTLPIACPPGTPIAPPVASPIA